MYMNLCPVTVGINGLTPQQCLELAARHGFGGVDLHLDGISSVQQAQELRHQLEQLHLHWGLFWLPADFIGCTDAEHAQNLNRLRQMLRLVHAAGCTRTYMHLWPSSDRPYGENFEHHITRLRPLVSLLADHGVQLGLEFLGPLHMRQEKPHPFIYRLPEMLELAMAVHESAGIVIDMFHWYCGGGTATEVRRLLSCLPNRIVNIHANDARPSIPLAQQHNYQRELPLATGVVDALGLIHTLNDIGYEGPVIAEPFHPQMDRLAQMSPDAVAEEISLIMRRLCSL